MMNPNRTRVHISGSEIACPEAEAGLLGACLFAPQAAAGLLDGLSADDFTTPVHLHVYAAMWVLLDRGEPTEPVAVLAVLRRTRARLNGKDPGVVLAELLEAAIAPAGAVWHRRLVVEHTRRRAIVEVAVRLAQAAHTAEPDTLTHEVTTAIERLTISVSTLADPEQEERPAARLHAITGERAA